MNTNWKPIETADKASYILLCVAGDVTIGCWNKSLWNGQSMGQWVRDDGTEETPFSKEPTHWMPLPEAPPKFQNVFCSQCGNDFGPGNHGFSDCETHRRILCAAHVQKSNDRLN